MDPLDTNTAENVGETVAPAVSGFMDKVADFVEQVPAPVVMAFAGFGVLILALKFLSFFQFLLSIFLYSGKRVRLFTS